jgi:hypothetical protein
MTTGLYISALMFTLEFGLRHRQVVPAPVKGKMTLRSVTHLLSIHEPQEKGNFEDLSLG